MPVFVVHSLCQRYTLTTKTVPPDLRSRKKPSKAKAKAKVTFVTT